MSLLFKIDNNAILNVVWESIIGFSYFFTSFFFISFFIPAEMPIDFSPLILTCLYY